MDIRELTLKIRVDGKELKVLSSDTKRLASEVDSAGRKGAGSMAQFGRSLDTIQKRLSSIILTTIKWGTVIAGAFAAFSFGLIIREGVRFNQVIETSRIGIAAVVASTQELVTAQGETLAGAEKFNAALGLSGNIQQRLQIANLQTAATYEQLLLTAQAVIPAAAAQGIELEKSLDLTTALVQATSGIGLNMNQAVSEARSLLEGSINPMTDQLANALGITAATVKEWQKQGTLADEILNKLEDFVRAGKLTQESFAGITSNLQDAVSIVTGQAFEGTFNQIKRIGQELIDTMVSFTDETIKVNPKLLEIGQAIDREIVGLLEIAAERGGDFIESLDPRDVSEGLERVRLAVADIFTAMGRALQTFSSIPEIAQFGIIGALLFGGKGALLLPILASFNQEIADFTRALSNPNVALLDEFDTKIESARGKIRELQEELRFALNRGFDSSEVQGITDEINRWLGLIVQYQEQRRAVAEAMGDEAAQQGEINGLMGTAGNILVGIGDTLRETRSVASDVNSFFASMADNAFLAAFGITGVLQGVIDIQKRAAEIQKLVLTVPRPRPATDDDDGKAKKAARERERLEEQLADAINKIVLDREDYERFQIQETVEKARKAGVDKVLIAEFQAAKELEIEREKFKEFQDLLERRTDEQIKRNEEILAAFSDIRAANLPESLKLSEQLESDLADIQKALETQNITFEEAERERLITAQRYAELIADARKQEYIQSLKDSDSFIDQLKGGFLEFALAVESNGELAAQFFADTLSQMSQNFSDFFYNVLTGKFEDLVDVAKNAFRAILRAFLDMVSAIATRQIVVSIAGSLGIGKGQPGGAAGALGLGKDVAGLAGAGFGLFGGGAAAGGATAAAIGGTAGGIGSVGVSGLTGGISVGTLAGGGSTGILATIGAAAPYVGAVLAAAAIAYTILGPLLKKTPRLDIDFDSVKTDMGRRAAVVEEFLSPDFFLDNIGQVSVKRGGVGLGAGGDEAILELIQERLQETIEGIQDIIRRLPAELFDTLNETLLNAEIDIDTVIGGERLLEFDAKGKKIAEKFQQFIEGELPAKFFAAIRESFFEPAFLALGVSADGTQSLIDDFLARMESAGSREARAAIGQEFIETFSAFVDAFNIVSGNANDAIGQTMNTIKALSSQLGFETVPSIDQLRAKLGELIESAELDPETVQAYADLRNAIVSLTSEIVNSISGLIGKMQSLNQTMASLGLATVDLGGYLSQAAAQIQSFLQNQGSNLSLGEQEAFLDQLAGIANAMLAEEQAAFNATQERLRAEAQRTFEAQRAVIQGRIDGLNQEKEAINEAFRSRIDALNEELRLAQAFAAATESIRNTLDGIIFSQQSIFTAVERVNLLQGNIADLQNQIANTSDPDRQLDLISSLEDAFATLFDTAGEAFGVNSPEFVSIFDQVTGGLSDLANLTENRGRSAEEIQAEIERLTAANEAHLASIDSRIESAQTQLANLQQRVVDNTFVASRELQDLFSYIQGEYTRLLEERFKQLEEVSEFGFANELQGLEAIAGLAQDSLVTLKDQTSYLAQIASAITNGGSTAAGVPGFASGSGGLMDFGQRTLAFLHGREAVFTEPQLANLTRKLVTGGYVSSLQNQLPRTPEQVVRDRTADIAGDSKKTIEVIIHSDNPAVVQTVTAGLAKELAKEMAKEIDPTAVTLKGAVQNASRKAPR